MPIGARAKRAGWQRRRRSLRACRQHSCERQWDAGDWPPARRHSEDARLALVPDGPDSAKLATR